MRPAVGAGTASPAAPSPTAPARATALHPAARLIVVVPAGVVCSPGVVAAWPLPPSLPVRQRVRAASASRQPDNAVTKLTSGAPPSAAYPVNGELVWLKATLAQGKPPNGTRPRTDSAATHSAAVQTGQPRSRRTTASAAP